MMDNLLDITVDEYRLVQRKNGSLYSERNGHLHQDNFYNNILLSFAYEIDDLREQLAEARLSELAALGQAQDAHTAQLEAEARALRVGEAVREAAVNLIQAVESNDRPNWASHGSWAHACELYAMRIYALDVSKIAQGVK